MRRLVIPALAVALVAAGSTAAVAGSGATHPPAPHRLQVRALVVGTFAGEVAPWLEGENLPITLTVPGLAVAEENVAGTVHCSRKGLCVTVVGTTKSKSGPGTTALLTWNGWDLSRAHFLLVGIAGISSWNGTIGDAGIGNIVDTNLGTDYVNPRMGHAVHPPLKQPAGWDPFDEDNPYTQATYKLPLADWAFNLTRHVKLADSAPAQHERAFYGPAEAREHPSVRRCGVAGHDSFWVGKDQALRQDRIYAYRAHQFGLDDRRCTSAFEDPGWAGALSRFGLLDRAVVVRTGSDFEDQRPGTTPADLYDLLHSDQGFAAFGIAVENEYLTGRVIAHAWTD
jgi:purine nucleoside permease